MQFGHTNSSFVKIKGWQKPRGLMLLLKSRLVKLCTTEAVGSEGSSVVWSSPCTLLWPESSQELQHHPAPLAGVVPQPHLVTALHSDHPGNAHSLQMLVQLLMVGSVMKVSCARPFSG